MTLAKMIRPKHVQDDSKYDIILKAWLGHKMDELPDELKKMVERWRDADDLLRNGVTITAEQGGTPGKAFGSRAIVDFLMQKHNISARTAWDDIASAKVFFLSHERRPDKEFARGVMIDLGRSMMHKAFETGDYKAAAAFYKELNAIQGLHDQDADVPDYAEFQPPAMVIVTNPAELGFEPIDNKDALVAKILKNGRQGFLQDDATDAEVIE